MTRPRVGASMVLMTNQPGRAHNHSWHFQGVAHARREGPGALGTPVRVPTTAHRVPRACCVPAPVAPEVVIGMNPVLPPCVRSPEVL